MKVHVAAHRQLLFWHNWKEKKINKTRARTTQTICLNLILISGLDVEKSIDHSVDR